MIAEISPLWLQVGEDLKSPGDFDVFFCRRSSAAYLTGDDHYVYWNGFLLNYEPLDYNGMRNCITEFHATI